MCCFVFVFSAVASYARICFLFRHRFFACCFLGFSVVVVLICYLFVYLVSCLGMFFFFSVWRLYVGRVFYVSGLFGCMSFETNEI